MSGLSVAHIREHTAPTNVMQACAQIHRVKTLAERLAAAREELGISQRELAKRAGVSASTIGNFEAGIRTDPRKLVQIANAAGVAVEWLSLGKGPRKVIPPSGDQPPTLAGTLPPNLNPAYKALATLTWGRLMDSASGEFRVAVPDDAMSPRVRQGQMVVFSGELDPKPGDGVLVQDSTGTHFFRQYQERKPGHWQAVAMNAAYQPLDSIADGLKVLAVLIAVEARWA